ncbi:hypothetical protein ABEP00_09160 [Heyndrickxia sporothermodurans]
MMPPEAPLQERVTSPSASVGETVQDVGAPHAVVSNGELNTV